MRRPSIADFIEDELLRAPLLFDAVIDVVVGEWRQSLSIVGRGGGELARMLQLRRNEALSAALRSLRQAVTAGRTFADRAPAAPRLELSLVDESNVVADLEIGRCAERIKSDAEAEFRDIHAYTSALVGDFAVSRETNPFRPEAFARAMWAGFDALPAAPAVRQDAFRRAIGPLARCVRSTLTAACERLAAQGVEPATYRTLIFQPGSGSAVTERVHFPPEDLTTLRDSMLGTLDRVERVPAPAALGPGASEAGDPALAQLIARLYGEMCAEAGLPTHATTLLAELRPAVERIAQRDGGLIDHFEHPAWRFVDRLVYTLATTPHAEQTRLVGLARSLVAHLAGDPALDAARFAWALEKLLAHDQQALTLAVQASTDEIEKLVRAAASAGPDSPALDVGALDTVPGDMLDGGGPSAADRVELAPTSPGDRLRMFLQGEWRVMQLMWSGNDQWLLRETTQGRHWALRAGVVERLAAERLARPFRMRSLARRAAERLQANL